MLRALVFDFDGLIVDTETPLIDAYGDVYAEEGRAFDRELFVRHVGHVDYTFDPWAALGPGRDTAALEARRRSFNLARIERQPVLPGVQALIDSARAAGLALGICSNSSHAWVEGHLQRLGLHACFSQFVCRGDTPSPKPEPDPYRLVCNRLGLRTCEAVALEDSQTGILAARRAGLWTVAVPNVSTADHNFDQAHVCVASMEAVTLELLRSRFG